MSRNLFVRSLSLIYMCSLAYGQCPAVCRPNQSSPLLCIINDRGDLCSRMPQCEVDEINCRLMAINRPSLTRTDLSHCRNNRYNMFAEPCANMRRQRRSSRSNCKHMRCLEPSQTLDCYRSADNRCQLLTSCQLQRVNCERSAENQLNRDDPRLCGEMRAGEALQTCSQPTNRHG